jgi:hypothetical protein
LRKHAYHSGIATSEPGIMLNSTAPTAQTVATRQAHLLKAYGLTPNPLQVQQALNAAHTAAQSTRFAASPSFAAMLEQALAQHRSKRGGA